MKEDLLEIRAGLGDFGVGRQIGHRTIRHLAPLVHDDHAAADFLDEMQQMRGQQDGGAVSRARDDRFAHAPDPHRVESGQRLVEEQRGRVTHQTAGDHHLLAHAPGQLTRQQFFFAAQFEFVEQSAGAALDVSHSVEACRPGGDARSTVRYSNRCGSSGMKASRRLASSGCRTMSYPSMSTCPLVGFKMPASERSVVVLPAPFGPMRPTISPAATPNDRSSTATNAP